MAKKKKYRVKKRYMHKFLRSIQAIRGEAVVNFDYTGIHALQVDLAHVGMVSAQLDRTGFEKYEMIEGKYLLDVDCFREAIKPFVYDDILEITIEDGEYWLDIEVRHGNRKTWFRTGAEEFDKPNIPDLSESMNTEFELENSDLRDLCKMASDEVRFNTLKEYGVEVTTFDSNSETKFVEDNNRVYMAIELEDEVKEWIEDLDNVVATDYLKSISKAQPKKSTLKVETGIDYPSRIGFKREEGVVRGYYLVAPRIRSD